MAIRMLPTGYLNVIKVIIKTQRNLELHLNVPVTIIWHGHSRCPYALKLMTRDIEDPNKSKSALLKSVK